MRKHCKEIVDFHFLTAYLRRLRNGGLKKRILPQLENKCWGKGHYRTIPRIVKKVNKPRR